MFDDRIGNLQKMLARMGPEGRQRYAADHADDPIAVSMALFVNNIAKELKEGKRGEPEMQAPVVQQAIQAMNQPRMPQGMPPQGMPPQGQPQAPQAMPQQGPQAPQGQPQMAADGGYMDSRLPEEMGIGALPERSLSNMADGGIVGFADGGTPKEKKQASFDNALDVEGIRDPRERAFLKALHGQESNSGQNTTTSNRGAVGGMQILPGTFKQVADKNMDINDPFDNMRAGIRYGMKGYNAAGGDPVLAGAYYYGGPGGMRALAQGTARSDPENPKAPNTREYGQSIAKRMERNLPTEIQIAKAQAASKPKTVAQVLTEALPIGTAQGQTPPAAAPAAPAPAPAAAAKKSTADKIRETLLPPIDTKPISEVPRGVVQGLASQIAGLAGGVAGAVMPGKEGQGADYAKRAEQYVGGYDPTSESSKRILDALGYLPNKFSEYVSKPVGEAVGKATGSASAEDIATRIADFLPAFIPGGRKGKTPTKVAEAAPVQAPVPAPAPTPAVRTVPLPKQVAAGNPSVTTAKPPVAQPPVAQPRPEGIERLNRAKENNAKTKLEAEQKAAAAAGTPPPSNLAPNQTVVPAPKPNVEGGLPSIITPEAAAFKAEAVAKRDARAEARAAERAAEKAAEPAVVKPITVAADAVKTAEAAKAAEAQVAAGSRAALQERPAPFKFPTPSVAGGIAVGAGAAATEGANNTVEREPYSTGDYKGRSGIADIDIGPAQERPSFDRTSGDDTTHFPSITPKIAETAVALAQAEIPKKEQGGFGYEDLMMFGLNLMAGQSPNALTNVGTAGIAALTSRQARAKAEADRKKEESDALKNTAYSKYIESLTENGPGEREEKNAIARLAAEGRIQEAEARRLQIQIQQGTLNEQRQAAHNLAVEKAKQKALAENPNYRSAFRDNEIAKMTLGQNPSEEKIKAYQKTQNLLQDAEDEALKRFNPPKAKFIGFE